MSRESENKFHPPQLPPRPHEKFIELFEILQKYIESRPTLNIKDVSYITTRIKSLGHKYITKTTLTESDFNIEGSEIVIRKDLFQIEDTIGIALIKTAVSLKDPGILMAAVDTCGLRIFNTPKCVPKLQEVIIQLNDPYAQKPTHTEYLEKYLSSMFEAIDKKTGDLAKKMEPTIPKTQKR